MKFIPCHTWINNEKKLARFTKWINYGPDNRVGAIVMTDDGNCHLVDIDNINFHHYDRRTNPKDNILDDMKQRAIH